MQSSHELVLVQCGRAPCTVVLLYVSIRLREIVSKFTSIERFSTGVMVQQIVSPGTLLIVQT